MAGHSLYSASASKRWMGCPGSVRVTADAEDSSNVNSARGTVAHTLLEACIAKQQLGLHLPALVEQDGFEIAVGDDMLDAVKVAFDYVEKLRPHADFLLTEQRVNYARYLQVDDEQAWGIADILIGMGSTLIVADYKHGYRAVESDAPQLRLYGLGALASFNGLAETYEDVLLVVIQPKSGGVKEHRISVPDLEAWAVEAYEAAVDVRDALAASEDDLSAYIRPGKEQCQWCPIKATCGALRDWVKATVTAPYDTDAETLGRAMADVDLVEGWATAVRAETERQLLAGHDVPGWKLVQGRKGSAKWASEEEAEELLKKVVRLKADDMYEKSIISPTTARKLAKKGLIPAKKVPLVEALITQKEGGPSVAPAADPRPAITVSATDADFDDLTGGDEPLA